MEEKVVIKKIEEYREVVCDLSKILKKPLLSEEERKLFEDQHKQALNNYRMQTLKYAIEYMKTHPLQPLGRLVYNKKKDKIEFKSSFIERRINKGIIFNNDISNLKSEKGAKEDPKRDLVRFQVRGTAYVCIAMLIILSIFLILIFC